VQRQIKGLLNTAASRPARGKECRGGLKVPKSPGAVNSRGGHKETQERIQRTLRGRHRGGVHHSKKLRQKKKRVLGKGGGKKWRGRTCPASERKLPLTYRKREDTKNWEREERSILRGNRESKTDGGPFAVFGTKDRGKKRRKKKLDSVRGGGAGRVKNE